MALLESITTGSTQQTRDEVRNILARRIDEADFDASVYDTNTDDEQYLTIEVAESDESTARKLLSSRGAVRIDLYYEDSNGAYTNKTGLTGEDFSGVGSATQDDHSGPQIPVTVESSAAEAFQQQLVDTGVAQSGGSQCTYDSDPKNTDPCMLLVEDDTVRNSFGMAPTLAVLSVLFVRKTPGAGFEPASQP